MSDNDNNNNKKRSQSEILSDLHELVHKIEHEQRLKEHQKKVIK